MRRGTGVWEEHHKEYDVTANKRTITQGHWCGDCLKSTAIQCIVVMTSPLNPTEDIARDRFQICLECGDVWFVGIDGMPG